jgi:biopolymer transport protein ExbD
VRKPKARIGVAIDMTPMVDVAFLLLIFFMTTTTFKPPEEVTVSLPVSHSEYKVPDTDVLILTVTRNEVIYSQVGTHDPMARVEYAQVGALVKAERSKNTRLRLIVKADKECPYGLMEDLMNTLQEVRTNRFVLMTEGEAGSVEGTKELTDEEASLGNFYSDPGAGQLAMAGRGSGGDK